MAPSLLPTTTLTSPSDQTWRSSREYRLWRIVVIRRDKVCQCCGDRDGRHAHHIKDASSHPELRFDTRNGVTLCYLCHMMLHNKIAGGYRNGCDEKHFDRLMYMWDRWQPRVIADLERQGYRIAFIRQRTR